MANLNFQQPPRSLGGGGGAARGFGGGGGGGHVTPTFGSGAAPQQLSPNRSQQLVGGAGAGTAARGGSQPGGGNSSIFAPRAFPPDRRSVPGGLGSVMPDWSSSTLGNMGSFGMPPSRSAYSSSNSSGAGAAGGGNNSFHSVFGGGGDSGSTPPVLDLSEFPSLTNRGGGGGGGGGAGGLGGGVGGGGQGDAMPNTMPGKQPYGPNMDSVTLTTASCNKAINEEELSVTLHSLPASFPSKSLTARYTVNALTLDTELGENELSTTEFERLDEFFMESGVTDKGDLENVRGLKLTTQGFLKGNFVESGDSHVVADDKYQEKLDALELPTHDSLQESSVVVENSSTVTEDEQQASFHKFRMSTTEFDSITEKFVKFGDNSIITSHVAPILASKLPTLSSDEPDFLRKLCEVCDITEHGCVRVVDNNIQVFSRVTPCKFGGPGRLVDKAGTVFPVLDAPLESANTDFLEVKFSGHRHRGIVDEAVIKPYLFKEGVVNGEAFDDVFICYLQPAAKYLCSFMAKELFSNHFFSDTCALYAKGVTYALQIDIAEWAGTQTQVVEFGEESVVSYIDLDDANIDVSDWKGHFAKGSIQLMEGEHYSAGAGDLQVIHWLAKAGHRITGVAQSKTNMCHYIKWPSIDFLLIRHGPAVNAPNAQMITSLEMMIFLERLACKRGEWDSFCHGIYIALDLVGVRYRTVDGHNYHLSSDFNTSRYQLPYPMDFNFFIRYLKPAIPFTEARYAEVRHYREWFNYTTFGKAKVAALYTAMRSAMATTLLASLNITTRDITEPSSRIERLCSYFPDIYRNDEFWFSMKLRRMFQYFFGLVLDGGYYYNMNWNGIPCSTNHPKAEKCLGGLDANVPPYWFSPLVVDDFLLTRPLEWGMVGPFPKVDFKGNLQWTAKRKRVHSNGGNELLMECVTSGTPFDFFPYGVQVMNVVLQSLSTNEPSIIMYKAMFPVFVKSEKYWTSEELQPFTDFIYDADLCCLQPCTLPSYSWQAEEIRSPVYLLGDNSEIYMKMMYCFGGQKIEFIGYYLKRKPIYVHFGGFSTPLIPCLGTISQQ